MLVAVILFTTLLLYTSVWNPKNTRHFYKQKPLYLGHRGDIHKQPENTTPSYLSALERGMSGLELDVLSTKDGVVICSHNFDLERKTAAEGIIDRIGHAQLTSIAPSVPSLEDALLTIPANVIINIEVKTRTLWNLKTAISVVRLIKKHKKSETTIVSSFNPLIILLTAIVDRKIYTAFIVRDIRWIWLTDWIHPEFLHAEYGLINDDIIRFVKERRVRLNAWTVNSRAGIKWLRRIGSDGIITDRPEFCRS